MLRVRDVLGEKLSGIEIAHGALDAAPAEADLPEVRVDALADVRVCEDVVLDAEGRRIGREATPSTLEVVVLAWGCVRLSDEETEGDWKHEVTSGRIQRRPTQVDGDGQVDFSAFLRIEAAASFQDGKYQDFGILIGVASNLGFISFD